MAGLQARKVARILREIHDESFEGDQGVKFSITWPELRELAGGQRLTGKRLKEIGALLREAGFILIPLENVLVVAEESEIIDGREVPGSVVDLFLGWEEEGEETDSDSDDEDLKE